MRAVDDVNVMGTYHHELQLAGRWGSGPVGVLRQVSKRSQIGWNTMVACVYRQAGKLVEGMTAAVDIDMILARSETHVFARASM